MASLPQRTAATDDHLLGQDDIFFTREGGESYLKDLPRAEMHRLNSGHFAVEDCLATIVDKMTAFYKNDRTSANVNQFRPS